MRGVPGLSQDPDKRQRQLDALAGGRRAQAERLLSSQGSAPAKPRQRAPKPGQGAQAGGGELPVHDYAKPKPKPSKPRKERAPRAQERPAEDQPRRGGGFLEGLRRGVEL